MAQLRWCIVTQIAFVWLSPLCVLNAFSNRLVVNMHGHSWRICLVFKCILKLIAWTDANSHSLHLFTLHHYVFWNCSDISGAPCYHCNFGFICPSHLKYHMKRIAIKGKEAYYKGEKLYNLTGYVWTSIASKSMLNNAEFCFFLTEIRAPMWSHLWKWWNT